MATQEAIASGTLALMTDVTRTAETTSDGRQLPLLNRELSWLEFNRRVLGEALSDTVPLLERLKFLGICANNLDEFFMIRVGAMHELLVAPIDRDLEVRQDQLDAVRRRCRKLLDQMYGCFIDDLLPQLIRAGIQIERVADLGKKERALVADCFEREIEPILTPLAVDPSHPFPLIANLSLNLAMVLEAAGGERCIVVLKIPESLPRLVKLGDARRFVFLEDVIASHVGRFFPGLRLQQKAAFRVIRNSDFSVKEDDVQDLLKSVESELKRRERRDAVWVEIESAADDPLVELLTRSLDCDPMDVFLAPGPLKLADLRLLCAADPAPELHDPPFNPRIASRLATTEDIFSIIRQGDVLLHRPYESFATVIEFVRAAAEDPDVVAIKQTLYRIDVGSPIIEALAIAASMGKQVTAVVELQARFDEKRNISWARHLEQAGVHVVFGLVGRKTHCKVCLVVRREGSELRRYVHLATGNYNAVTARLYEDVDFFTCDPEFGLDAAQLLNLLTGFSAAGVQELIDGDPVRLPWRRMIVAPMDYHRWVIEKIDREAAAAKAGRPAGIAAKMNGLADPSVISALYRASRAGVSVRLLVRGICCLVPGLPGVSENIEVVSVIDRFLEHSRIFRFENDGTPEIFLSSGDWMPRNFFRRIEATFPVRAPALVRRIEEQLLPLPLADNVKSWVLRADGKYERRRGGDATPVRSQEAFITIARAEAVHLGAYEEMLRNPGQFRRKMKKRKKQK